MDSKFIEELKTRVLHYLKGLVSSKALTLIEPEIFSLAGVRLGQVRHISKLLTTSDSDEFKKFPNLYGRHTTLAGILSFLEKDHVREYLITAFGKRKTGKLNGPAQYEGFHISHGGESSVGFSEKCLHYLNLHSKQVNKSEILIFHNHPNGIVRDFISQLVDWSPLPSNTDRDTVYHFKRQGVIDLLTSGKYGIMKFYLVEMGRLREIKWPSLDRIMKILKMEF